MLQRKDLGAAAEEFVTAALLGHGWEQALERLSSAAGARGAVLMRTRGARMVAGVTTSEVAEAVADFLAGRTPPNSRQTRTAFSEQRGFNVDHDDYTDDELARDPYYQEFLRPRGFFWHSAARLDTEGPEHVTLSFKRGLDREHYQREDTGPLNAILPELRAATRIARRVLDAEAAGVAQALTLRGAPVLELDPWGRVLRTHALRGPACCPIRVTGKRLQALHREEQPAIERAMATALRSPGRPSAVVLTDGRDERYCLQFVPIGGRARDVFLTASVVAVVVPLPRRPSPTRMQRAVIQDAFELTGREADIAMLIGTGSSPAQAAQALHLGLGTVRHHLKSVLEKTDTHRQAELTALVARLAP